MDIVELHGDILQPGGGGQLETPGLVEIVYTPSRGKQKISQRWRVAV